VVEHGAVQEDGSRAAAASDQGPVSPKQESRSACRNVVLTAQLWRRARGATGLKATRACGFARSGGQELPRRNSGSDQLSVVSGRVTVGLLSVPETSADREEIALAAETTTDH